MLLTCCIRCQFFGYILVQSFKSDTINNLDLSMKACGASAPPPPYSYAARLSLRVSSYINTSGTFSSPSLFRGRVEASVERREPL